MVGQFIPFTAAYVAVGGVGTGWIPLGKAGDTVFGAGQPETAQGGFYYLRGNS